MENNIKEIETLENVEETSENKMINPEVTGTKKYEFRKLGATDISLITRVIKKIGINKIKNIFKNDDLKNLISGNSNGKDLTIEVGIEVVCELVQLILEVYEDVEGDLHKLLSDTSDLKLEEVQTLEMEDFLEMLFDFFKKKEFMGFFNRALRLLGMAD